MTIKIGNNNKIEKSLIGNGNKTKSQNNVLVTIITTIIAGVIVAGIVYYMGWN